MDDFELQRLGTNAEAQNILTQEISAAFPQLEAERGMSDTVIDQFYDWSFPFLYGSDGGGARKWRTAVQAVCRKNPKLQELEAFFAASGTDGTFKEVYSGQDEDDYTDNHATRTRTTFSGVSTTTSENLGDETETAPVDGRNTTSTIRKKGTTRTYADGRTWTQILRDVGLTVDPVFEFINSFAQTLLPPCEDPCEALPPSVAMTAQAEALEVGSAPTAEIVNRGTPVAADWLLKLGLPKGVKGDDGAAATIEVGEVTTGAAGTDAQVVNVGTPNAAVLNFTIPRGDTGAAGGGTLYAHTITFYANNHTSNPSEENQPCQVTLTVICQKAEPFSNYSTIYSYFGKSTYWTASGIAAYLNPVSNETVEATLIRADVSGPTSCAITLCFWTGSLIAKAILHLAYSGMSQFSDLVTELT